MKTEKYILIEACVNSVESAVEAQKGGALRVELCDNMYEGGTTPSSGAILTARKLLEIDLFTMIRPRGGDFCYSDTEYEIMKHDVSIAKELGVDGIVFGILSPDGSVDMERCHRIVKMAGSLNVTFHRAFDMTADPFRALEDLIQLGVHRILTSGQHASAAEGAGLIKELIGKAGDRIIIMPGVDVNESNVRQLITNTGAREFHVYLQKKVDSPMTFRNLKAFMGSNPELPEYETFLTDRERIRAVTETVRGL
jgi:copper homeostasis protein